MQSTSAASMKIGSAGLLDRVQRRHVRHVDDVHPATVRLALYHFETLARKVHVSRRAHAPAVALRPLSRRSRKS